MFAYFNVSEPEYLDYETDIKNRAQNQVGLLLANGVPLKYKGTVEVIERNLIVKQDIRSRFPNPEKLLKNGETGKVLMTVPLKNALVIPQKSNL
jgi:membrane fusion protein (multidrug efflux system)